MLGSSALFPRMRAAAACLQPACSSASSSRVHHRAPAPAVSLLQTRSMAHGRTWMDKRGRHGFKKRRTVEVVLFEDIPGVGSEGQVLTVAKGHGMNFFVRNGKGAIATKLNRHLYAKPLSEVKPVEVGESTLVSRLKKWVKRIETLELLFPRFKPSINQIEIGAFEIVTRLNRTRKMCIPPFTMEAIQPIVEKEDEVNIFSRKDFDQKLRDFDALQLGPKVDSKVISRTGTYVVTFDLAKGLDLAEPIPARLRINVSEHGENPTEPKKPRTPNPRKAMYRHRMGIEGAEWNGWDNYKVTN